jgi:glutathione peroxidase
MNVYDFSVKAADGGTRDLRDYAGQLYEHVRSTRPEAIGTDEIKWNFTKFLVARTGQVAGRYEPTVTPEDLRPDLDALLAA